jgi:hypothetical protein
MDFAGETSYFCSEHCLHAFEINPHDSLGKDPTPSARDSAASNASVGASGVPVNPVPPPH